MISDITHKDDDKLGNRKIKELERNYKDKWIDKPKKQMGGESAYHSEETRQPKNKTLTKGIEEELELLVVGSVYMKKLRPPYSKRSERRGVSQEEDSGVSRLLFYFPLSASLSSSVFSPRPLSLLFFLTFLCCFSFFLL